MTAAVTAPLVAIGVKSIEAASNLSESMNAVNVVFEDAAGIIADFAKNSAETLGLSTADFNQLAAVTGAFLQNVGFDAAAAAEETINLGSRAADMASIFNTDVTTALNAIQSGLKGEFNPLEQFGVKLNAATIEAKALAMGLADQTGAINDTAKAQAALALIYEQTDKFAGDFTNTSDGLANSTKILKAQMTNLSAEIGNVLMPIGLELTKLLSNLVERFTNLSPETQKTILVVAGLAAAIGPLLLIVGTLITSISAIIPVVAAVAGVLTFPLIAVIAAVGLAIAALYLAWKNNWGGIRDFITNVWETKLKPAFEAISDWLQTNIPKAIETVKTFWETKLLPALNSVWEFIDTYIVPIFKTVGEILDIALTLAVEAMAGLWENVLQPALETVWKFIQDNVVPILEDLRDFIVEHIGPKVQWFTDNVLSPLGAVLIDSVKQGLEWVNERLQEFKTALENLTLPEWLRRKSPSPFEMVFIGASEAIQELVEDWLPKLVEKIKSVEKTAWGMAEALLETASQFGGIASGFVPFFTRDVLDPIQREIDVWQERIDATGGTLEDMFDQLAEQGLDMTGQLENAFQTMDIGRLRQLMTMLRSLPPGLIAGVDPDLTQRAATNLEYIIGLIHERNVLEADFAAEQERILALQRQQQDLAFLQQQLELLDLIRELQLTDPLLDPDAILGGMQLGLQADMSGVLEAMTRAMQELIAAAETQLGIASPSAVFRRLGNFIMEGLASGIAGARLQPQLAFAGSVPGMLGAGAAAIPSPHYNLTIVSNARTEDVLSNFELMKALAGA